MIKVNALFQAPLEAGGCSTCLGLVTSCSQSAAATGVWRPLLYFKKTTVLFQFLLLLSLFLGRRFTLVTLSQPPSTLVLPPCPCSPGLSLATSVVHSARAVASTVRRWPGLHIKYTLSLFSGAASERTKRGPHRKQKRQTQVRVPRHRDVGQGLCHLDPPSQLPQ